MFNFYVENHEPFGLLTKNCLQLDKNKSIVPTFLVFVVYKSAVSTIEKGNYVGRVDLCQWRFVFAHLFLDISTKFTELHFQSWRKDFSNDFALFLPIAAKVSRNTWKAGKLLVSRVSGFFLVSQLI